MIPGQRAWQPRGCSPLLYSWFHYHIFRQDWETWNHNDNSESGNRASSEARHAWMWCSNLSTSWTRTFWIWDRIGLPTRSDIGDLSHTSSSKVVWLPWNFKYVSISIPFEWLLRSNRVWIGDRKTVTCTLSEPTTSFVGFGLSSEIGYINLSPPKLESVVQNCDEALKIEPWLVLRLENPGHYGNAPGHVFGYNHII